MRLADNVERLLGELLREGVEGTIKRGVGGNLEILCANLYLEDRVEAERTFSRLARLLEGILSEIEGEVIRIAGSGRILDMGKQSARILRSLIYEVYMYEERSSAIIRLHLESSPSERRIWISLDLDEVRDSPWFG